MEKLKNLTKKQKNFMLLALGIVLIFAFVVSSSFAKDRPDEKTSSPKAGQESQDRAQEEKTGTITKFSIASEKDSLAPGEQMQFTAFIEGDGDYDDSVTWSIQGDHNEKTNITPDGKLTVDLEEKAEQIIVRGSCGNGAYVSDKPLTIVQANSSFTPSTSTASAPAHQVLVAPKAVESNLPKEAKPNEGGQKNPQGQEEAPGQNQSGKPQGEGQGQTAEKSQASIRLLVENMAEVKETLKGTKDINLPDMDLVLEGENLDVQEGENVLAFIQRVLSRANVQVKVAKIDEGKDQGTEEMQEKIIAVNGLNDGDFSPKAHWLVWVNGKVPEGSLKQYPVKAQDKIDLVYTENDR